MEQETFGQRLKRLRNEQKLSQDELAEKVGCSRQTISNYERDERQPNIEMVSDLAKELASSYEYLVEATEEIKLEQNDLLNEFLEIKTISDASAYVKKLIEGFQVDSAYKTTLEYLINELAYMSILFTITGKIKNLYDESEYDVECFLSELEGYAYNEILDKRYKKYEEMLFEFECTTLFQENLARIVEKLSIILPDEASDLYMLLRINVLALVKYCRHKIYGDLSVSFEYGLTSEQ